MQNSRYVNLAGNLESYIEGIQSRFTHDVCSRRDELGFELFQFDENEPLSITLGQKDIDFLSNESKLIYQNINLKIKSWVSTVDASQPHKFIEELEAWLDNAIQSWYSSLGLLNSEQPLKITGSSEPNRQHSASPVWRVITHRALNLTYQLD
jgi:hypothetical protein